MVLNLPRNYRIFSKVQVDTRPDTMSNIASYYGVNSQKLQRHYKHKISGFKDWQQLSHAEDYLIYPENITDKISIDEVSLSKGELYTFVTNKNTKVKNKRSMVAIINALAQFNEWKGKVTALKIDEFNTVVNSIEYHLDNILNFFDNRSTNANAESFNSKIKGFRANLRGVTDVKFFLFRLEKLFA